MVAHTRLPPFYGSSLPTSLSLSRSTLSLSHFFLENLIRIMAINLLRLLKSSVLLLDSSNTELKRDGPARDEYLLPRNP